METPAPLVFAPGLEFDQGLVPGPEEIPVEREMPEEIGFPILHGEDEGVAADSAQSTGQGAAMPDEIPTL